MTSLESTHHNCKPQGGVQESRESTYSWSTVLWPSRRLKGETAYGFLCMDGKMRGMGLGQVGGWMMAVDGEGMANTCLTRFLVLCAVLLKVLAFVW